MVWCTFFTNRCLDNQNEDEQKTPLQSAVMRSIQVGLHAERSTCDIDVIIMLLRSKKRTRAGKVTPRQDRERYLDDHQCNRSCALPPIATENAIKRGRLVICRGPSFGGRVLTYDTARAFGIRTTFA